MNPAIQKAFEAFWECPEGLLLGDKEDAYKAFCAGYGFARYQAESAQTEAGARPAGNSVSAEDIYAAYPRKVAKKDALKAICNAMKTAGREKLLASTKLYAAAMAKCPLEERKFIPHPATWFNRGSYDDDPAEWGTPEVSQFSVSH